MAEQNLYSSDIAPLKNLYGFTSQESDYLSSLRQSQVMPELDSIIKLSDAIQRRKTNELNFQKAELAFKQEKEKAERQAEYLGKAEEATKIFDDIQNTVEDPYEATKLMGNWAMQNAKQLTEDDTTKAIYRAALSNINTKLAAKKARQEELDRDTGVAIQLGNLGDIEGVTSMIDADGVRTNKETAALNLATKQAEREQAKLAGMIFDKQEEQEMRLQKREGQEFAQIQSLLDYQIKTINDILSNAPTKIDKVDGVVTEAPNFEAPIVKKQLSGLVPEDENVLDYLGKLQQKKITDTEKYLEKIKSTMPSVLTNTKGSGFKK
jgi:hypothetical protein